jgi:hypothetical protein
MYKRDETSEHELLSRKWWRARAEYINTRHPNSGPGHEVKRHIDCPPTSPAPAVRTSSDVPRFNARTNFEDFLIGLLVAVGLSNGM